MESALTQGEVMQNNDDGRVAAPGQKKAWEPPTLSYVGDVEEVVQGGGGKLSVTSGDPGETKKQQPTG